MNKYFICIENDIVISINCGDIEIAKKSLYFKNKNLMELPAGILVSEGDNINFYNKDFSRKSNRQIVEEGLIAVSERYIFDDSLDMIREMNEEELIENGFLPRKIDGVFYNINTKEEITINNNQDKYNLLELTPLKPIDFSLWQENSDREKLSEYDSQFAYGEWVVDENEKVIFEIEQKIFSLQNQLTKRNHRAINCIEAIVEAFLQLPKERIVEIFGKTMEEILPYPKEELLPSFAERKEQRVEIDSSREKIVEIETKN